MKPRLRRKLPKRLGVVNPLGFEEIVDADMARTASDVSYSNMMVPGGTGEIRKGPKRGESCEFIEKE